jgi:hypothetical protein
MRNAVKDLHLYAAALARGGWDRMDSAAFGQVGGRVRVHYAYLDRFIGTLEAGLPVGNVVSRASRYAQAGRGTYSRARTAEAIAAGRLLRNVTNPTAEHCAECVALSDRGWIPADEMPPVGSRQCGPGCKCRVESKGGNERPAGNAERADLAPPAVAGPMLERRAEPRELPEFQVGDRVRGRVTIGTVIGREPDGRYVVRADDGRVTRIRPGALRPHVEATPPEPPTTASGTPAPTPAPPSVPTADLPRFADAGRIRAHVGAYVEAPGGRVRGLFVGMTEDGLARVRTDQDTYVSFRPSELTIGTDPRLANAQLPPPDAPLPATLADAELRLRLAGGAEYMHEGPVPVNTVPSLNDRRFQSAAHEWGKPFMSDSERLAQARQATAQVERLKRMYPGLEVHGPLILSDTPPASAPSPTTRKTEASPSRR